MTLFYWNVPLSVLGRWCGVHKTTILRGVLGLALALWPIVSQGLVERVQAHKVDVDEKWLKIHGRWQSWFVVFDVSTELPVLGALLPSRRQWACRWIGAQRRQLKKSVGSSSRMGYRPTPTWCRGPSMSGVAFLTSRVSPTGCSSMLIPRPRFTHASRG